MMRESKKIFYGWWIVLALMAISGSALALTITTFNIYLNAFTKEMGISATQFALCSTIINITVMLFSPKVGKFIQHHTKKALFIFLIGFCISYAAFSIATNVMTLYVIAAFFGFFSTGLTFIPSTVLVNRWFIEKKGLAMSLALSGSALFGMLLSKYITYCIQHYSLAFAYQTVALMMFVGSALLIGFLIKGSPESIGLQALGEGSVSIKQNDSANQKLALVNLEPKVLKKKPFFWSMLAAQFLVGLVGGGIVLQLPVYLQNIFGLEQAANFLVISLAIMIFAKVILGWLYDRLGTLRTTIIVTISVLITCSSFIFTNSSSMWGLGLIGVMFWGIGNCIGTVTPAVVASKTYGQENYGEVYGICLRFQTLGIALGVPTISMLVSMTGSFTSVWIICSILTIFLLLFYAYGLYGSNAYRTDEKKEAHIHSTDMPAEIALASSTKF